MRGGGWSRPSSRAGSRASPARRWRAEVGGHGEAVGRGWQGWQGWRSLRWQPMGLEQACAKAAREMLGVSSGLIASHTRASRPGGSRQRPRKRRACVASRVSSAWPAPAATAFSTAASKACSYCNRSSSPMAAASRSLARSTASDVLCRFSGTRDTRFCLASSTSATIPSACLSAPLATPAALR